jgi:HAD superfamily hydrolase (TIGR01490 family)
MIQKTTRYYAFFDVDETLISIKSMFSFLKYYVDQMASDAQLGLEKKYNDLMKNIQLWSAIGVNREEINVHYYRFYAGVEQVLLSQLGEKWHRTCLKEINSFYNNKMIDELRWHKENDAYIVLVSGSFSACLEPIANYVQADTILATKLLIKRGVCTGEVLHYPVIGDGKAKAIKQYLAQRKYNDEVRCYAYGDHISDLPMLNMVGNPRVYANCEHLLRYAKEHCWKIITP